MTARKIATLMMTVLVVFTSAARTRSFERIQTDDGLPDSFVLNVHQDRNGFMWFGSMSGLVRYDGYTFKDACGFSGGTPFQSRIDDIFEDADGNFWLDVFKGHFVRFDPRQNRVTGLFPDDLDKQPFDSKTLWLPDLDGRALLVFDNLGLYREADRSFLSTREIPRMTYPYHQTDALEDSSGRIWITTVEGLIYLDAGSNDFQVTCPGTRFSRVLEHGTQLYFIGSDRIYTLPAGADPQKLMLAPLAAMPDIRFLEMLDNGNLCICSSAGLTCVQTGNWTATTLPSSSYEGRVTAFFSDAHDNIWFTTSAAAAFYRYDLISGKLSVYPQELHYSKAHSSKIISAHFDDSYGNLWIGTYADGLFEYDPDTDRMLAHQTVANDVRTINNNCIQDICEDRNGILWIATRKGGVAKLNLSQEEFENFVPDEDSKDPYFNECLHFIQDRQGRFIIPTYSNGLYIIDSQGRKYQAEVYIDGREVSELDFWFYVAYQDRQGRYWIGTKANGAFKADLHREGDRYLLDMKRIGPGRVDIYSIQEDRSGRIYLASYANGLYVLEPGADKVRHVRLPKPFEKTMKLSRDLLLDHQGQLWVAGMDGVYVLDISRSQNRPGMVRHFDARPDTPDNHRLDFLDVNVLYEDSQKNVWMGTNGGGLYCWSPETDSLTVFSEKDGLASRVVYGILEDKQHHFWFTTDKGLSYYQPEIRKFQTFLEEDGLQCATFSESDPVMDRKGVIHFGTVNGMEAIHPKKLKLARFSPKVMFTDFLLNNVAQQPGSDLLPEDINEMESLCLRWNQRDFSICFTTDMYDNPFKHHYEYMLEGYDKDWIRSLAGNSATYSNLPAGKYVFHVRYSDSHGEGTGEIRSLPIVIRKHFLLTWPAMLLYLALIVLAVWLVYRNRLSYYRLKNDLTVEKKLTDLKIRFFTNISHELRTMLTLIKAPLGKLELKDDEPNRKLTRTMQHNVDKLTYLVNEILDFRKVQNNKMDLKVSSTPVVTFFTMITELFRLTAVNKNIEYKVEVNGDESLVGWFDLEKVEKILTNLLSNALKFTPEYGTVEVRLILSATEMQFIVADNGIGFDTSDKHILDRYYRSDEVKSLQGTGIGLSLVQEYVHLHGGRMTYDSHIGKGSRFQVILPISKDHYTPDQLCKDEQLLSMGSYAAQICDDELIVPERKTTGDPDRQKILVVEDNRELREFLVDQLSADYTVLGFSDGHQAWDQVETLVPDLVISDVVMPEMDGLQLLEKVRQSPVVGHVIFILLSARVAIEDKIAGLEDGADDYLEKPFDFNYLKSRIANLLKKRREVYASFRNETSESAASDPAAQEKKAYLDHLEEYISTHLEDHVCDLDEISRFLQEPKSALTKKVKLYTGCSVNQYVKMVKLRIAASMLVEKDYTVFEACYAVGYNDVNHFRIQFKNLFNKTPSQYKRDAGM